MTRVRINGCLEEGCTNHGGLRLLCDEHAPAYAPTLSDTLTHGTGITGPDGKHLAIEAFFAPAHPDKTETQP